MGEIKNYAVYIRNSNLVMYIVYTLTSAEDTYTYWINEDESHHYHGINDKYTLLIHTV